ncbi:MAG TPA: tetratricopeptide repeat protein [Pyrinomonadaceae bacterium]|nr:tetratricopeptide repeat protein [Pyrinomonadaceae bacterium]
MMKYKSYLGPRASRPQSWPWRPAISEFVFATVAGGTRAVPGITLLSIIILLAVSPVVLCQKITREKLTSEGKKRSFYLYVPTSVKPESPVPLLILFHGSNRVGLSLADKWKELADQEGFIVVAPDSINSVGWAVPADGPVSIYDLVEDLKMKYPINSRRVYLFGHSAGAGFAMRMSLYESEYFASAAIHAGALDFDGIELIKMAKRKTPIHLQVGDRDPLFPVTDVRKTRDALAAGGFPVELKVIPNHNHWYYDLAPKINLTAWGFLKAHELPRDPLFEKYSFKEPSSKDARAATSHYNLGMESLRANDFAGAIAAFTRTIEVDDKHAEAYHNRGVAYARLTKDEAAIADFTRSIAIKPTEVAYKNRGGLYLNLRKMDDAVADFTEAIKLRPSGQSYSSRGLAYAQSGKEDLALADYDQAIKMDPGVGRTYILRGLLALKKREVETAEKDFDKGFKFDPGLHDEFDLIIKQIKISRGIN